MRFDIVVYDANGQGDYYIMVETFFLPGVDRMNQGTVDLEENSRTTIAMPLVYVARAHVCMYARVLGVAVGTILDELSCVR